VASETDAAEARPRLGRAVRILRFTLVACAVLYVVYCAVLFSLQRAMLFPGSRIEAPEGTRPPGPGSERVWIETPDGDRVEAWYTPAPGATAANPGPAVVLTHGNGELIDYMAPRVRPYLAMGVGVLTPEYRGYGRSGGAPSMDGIAQDMARFRAWLVARPEVDADRLVYHGFSLGGGVAGALAATHPPRALILQSTFTRIADMTTLPVPGVLIADPYDTAAVVRQAEYPVLVVHGTDDRVVPYHHGVRLSELAGDARLVTHQAGHQDMPDQQTYWREVRAVLVRSGVLTTPR
jgi:hypothetical protein